MEGRMRNALRGLAGLIVLCMLWAAVVALSAGALAEPMTYTYGGSGDDSILAIAASDDGRIVLTGYTNSTDGTLSSRTKSGHSGWALCVDAQGNVLWSFCSRLGTADRMDAPVFHEDGSVTVVLCAELGERDAYEVIRLDRNGEVVSRKTALGGKGVNSLYRPQVTGAGYILREYGDDLIPKRIALFDFDGNAIREMEEWVPGSAYTSCLLSQRHAIRVGISRAMFSAIDAQGNEAILTELQGVNPDPEGYAIYLKLVSLPDGGAVAAGRMDGEGVNCGRLTRWDAQGRTAFDWWIQTGNLLDLACTGSGFAALMAPYEQPAQPEEFTWSLAFFDESGVQTGNLPVGETQTYNGVLTALPDGGVALAQNTGGMEGDYDVRLTIIPKEDIP